MSFKISLNNQHKIFIQQRSTLFKSGVIVKIRNAFSEDGVYEFDYIENKIIDFSIPLTGNYMIEAWGANGGSENRTSGVKGAYSRSYVYFKKSENIRILVGEKGWSGHSTSLYCGGGGGGTFVAKNNTPLCVAGGGGGLSHVKTVPAASYTCGQSTQYGGNPGSGQAGLKMGGYGSDDAAGGAGFEGNGKDGSSSGKGGISFLNGGSRQTSGTSGAYGYGGFGGGGSRDGLCGKGAGGGGYTGGSASKSNNPGGGGGSYFEGDFNNEASFAISGYNSSLPTNPGSNGNGYAIITLLKSKLDPRQNNALICFSSKHFFWTVYATVCSQDSE